MTQIGKKVKDFEIGDYVTRTTEHGTITYKLIEKKLVTGYGGDQWYQFTGECGSSASLAGAPEHEHLSCGCDWYTAYTQGESKYSYKLKI